MLMPSEYPQSKEEKEKAERLQLKLVEQALYSLYQQHPLHHPPLNRLSQWELVWLQQLLESLLWERENSPLH